MGGRATRAYVCMYVCTACLCLPSGPASGGGTNIRSDRGICHLYSNLTLSLKVSAHRVRYTCTYIRTYMHCICNTHMNTELTTMNTSHLTKPIQHSSTSTHILRTVRTYECAFQDKEYMSIHYCGIRIKNVQY